MDGWMDGQTDGRTDRQTDRGNKVFSCSQIKGPYFIYIYFWLSFSVMLINMLTEINVQEHDSSDLIDELLS